MRLIGKPILRRGTAAPLRRHYKVQTIRYLDGAREGETWPLGKLNAAMAAWDRMQAQIDRLLDRPLHCPCCDGDHL